MTHVPSTYLPLRFQPKLIPSLAALFLFALFVYLGLWQQNKGERLESDIAQREVRGKLNTAVMGRTLVDATSVLDSSLTVRGHYDQEAQFYLDNRQHKGQPGVHVITPLRIENSQTRVLINRGWIGWGASRQVLPVVGVPQGPVEVSGIAALPSQKDFFLMPKRDEAFSQLWSRLDLKRYIDKTGFTTQPVVILLETQSPADIASPPLVREWPVPPDKVGMHKGYAVQWFGMALALLVFYGVASLRRGNGETVKG